MWYICGVGKVIEKDSKSQGWFILRTSGSQTLALAASLTEVAFEVWTPVETRLRLVGRKRERIEQEVAILPGYVFADMGCLQEMLSLSRSPALGYRVWDPERRRMVAKGHPYFTVFHPNGKIRAQSDLSLAPLRALEEGLAKLSERRRERELTKGSPPKFNAGEIVRVGSGGFEGLQLVVAESNDGKTVKLMHPDWAWPVEISAWKLHAIQVANGSPARAADLAA
jgi:transcription antitermination factor NusG